MFCRRIMSRRASPANAEKKRVGRSLTGDGCGYLLLICLVTCCFLALNIAFCDAIYDVVMAELHDGFAPLHNNGMVRTAVLRAGQAMLLLGPLLLTALEWWLVDRASQLRRVDREEEPDDGSLVDADGSR